MTEDREKRNIYNIDGSERYRGNRIRKPKKKLLSFVGPEHVGAMIFFLILVYLLINLYIYKTKDETLIYEVVADSAVSADSFRGIVTRNEKLVYADHTGNISYYVGEGRRVAKGGVVFSIDNGSDIYEEVRDDYSTVSLSDDEITEIKDMITRYMNTYDSMNIAWVSEFELELGDTVADRISTNMVADMEQIRDSGISRSAFYVCRSGSSGVISYRSDSLTGLSSSSVTPDMLEKSYPYEEYRLRQSGLIDSSEAVYRICSDESWSIVCVISDTFYMDHLEGGRAVIYINGSNVPVESTMTVRQSGTSYLAEFSMDDYMSEYINTRYVNIKLDNNTADGLKIPASSVVSKPYYLVPLTCFSAENGFKGYVLRKAVFDENGSYAGYTCIYPSRYYSDGYYAYIDKELLSEEDLLIDTASDNFFRVSAINYLEGVYLVNKGYYQFVRIEKLRQNSEYAIICSDTPYGLRRYDRIAINGSEAVENAIIY